MTSGLASKRSKGKSNSLGCSVEPEFSVLAHPLWYNRLSTWRIGESRGIDWDVLHDVGLVEEVQGVLRVCAFSQLFAITDATYQELMLKFLVSFKLEHNLISFHRTNTIQF